MSHFSAAASGWAGWALAHPEFGCSVNPITTRGADYALHITASPPGFENPAASLHVLIGVEYQNCCQTLDVYLLFAIWMGQIQSQLIYIFVT